MSAFRAKPEYLRDAATSLYWLGHFERGRHVRAAAEELEQCRIDMETWMMESKGLNRKIYELEAELETYKIAHSENMDVLDRVEAELKELRDA